MATEIQHSNKWNQRPKYGDSRDGDAGSKGQDELVKHEPDKPLAKANGPATGLEYVDNANQRPKYGDSRDRDSGSKAQDRK